MFLIIYMFITGFSPSIVRASIMAIIFLCSKLFFRKNDILTSISLSLLIILVYNPFSIENLGVQFSYAATIGIILLNKNVKKILKSIRIKNKKWKYRIKVKTLKIINKIQDILSISISAQIAILPIMIYHSNIFDTYFWITNLIVSIIIVPLLIFSLIIVVCPYCLTFLLKFFSIILNILVNSLLYISSFSKLPFSKIYISTPKVYFIILYYIILFITNIFYSLYHKRKLNNTEIRIRNLIALAKYKVNSNKSKIFKILLIFLLIIICSKLIPKNLRIHFVDVNQGDCTSIETPMKKTILVDGGGSESKDFDVGENILVPYILDRGYTKIDYIIVSHMDQDHVGGLLSVIQEIEVKNIVISKQSKDSDNFEKLMKLINNKKINLILVNMGDKVKIEKDLYFDILWPDDRNFIEENPLNNNSIVCKLNYKKFSILFSGDIEEIAEKRILERYKENLQLLNATIFKVPHHGSKTSSSEDFIKEIKSNISLIGVGKENRFGHPNDEVIERLEKYGNKIYRTDNMGEISIEIDKEGNVRVDKSIKNSAEDK